MNVLTHLVGYYNNLTMPRVHCQLDFITIDLQVFSFFFIIFLNILKIHIRIS